MRYFTVLSVAFVGMLTLATAVAPAAHAQEMEQSPSTSMTPPSDMGQDVNQIQEAEPKAEASSKASAKKHGKKHAKKHAKKAKKHHKKAH